METWSEGWIVGPWAGHTRSFFCLFFFEKKKSMFVLKMIEISKRDAPLYLFDAEKLKIGSEERAGAESSLAETSLESLLNSSLP